MVKPFDKWSEVIIALGSNLNDRKQEINNALTAIDNTEGLRLVKCSEFLPYKAEGFDSDNEFLNAVCICESNIHPELILKQLLLIENKQNRLRNKEGYSDRSIDLDLISYGEIIYKTKFLELPHPRLHLRKFVLEPLLQVSNEWIHPKTQKSAASLLSEI